MAHRLFSDRDDGFARFYCDTKILTCRDAEQAREKSATILVDIEQVQNVLILTDEGVSQTRFYAEVCPHGLNITVAKLGYESNIAPMQAAIDTAQEHKCQAILAIGGGSVLDSAKLIAATLGSGTPLEGLRDTNVLARPALPLICIPTTFGTGSECNMYGHLTTPDAKIGLRKAWLTPKYAVLVGTPALELSSEQRYLTGLDAWSHAFEALTVKRERSAFSDALLRTALDLHKTHFKAFVESPTPDNALAIATASAMAGIGLNNARTGVIHTLAVAFAAHFKKPHTQAIVPFIEPAIHFNWAGIADQFSTDDVDTFIADLREHTLFGAHDVMSQWAMHVSAEDIAAMTHAAESDTVLIKENPCDITSQDISHLFQSSLKPWMTP